MLVFSRGRCLRVTCRRWVTVDTIITHIIIIIITIISRMMPSRAAVGTRPDRTATPTSTRTPTVTTTATTVRTYNVSCEHTFTALVSEINSDRAGTGCLAENLLGDNCKTFSMRTGCICCHAFD